MSRAPPLQALIAWPDHGGFGRDRRVQQHVHNGLALGKDIKTDCSINGQIGGKTYCFGSQDAKTEFMKDTRCFIDE